VIIVMALFYIFIFAGVLLLTFLTTYLICYFYIKQKRAVKPKYHYTSPVEEKALRRDYELKPTNQTGIDGDSALKRYHRG